MVKSKLDSAILKVACHVEKFRQSPQLLQHLGSKRPQLIQIGIFQRVLKLGAAHTAVELQILNRLEGRAKFPSPA